MAKQTIRQLAERRARLLADLAKVDEEIASRHGEVDPEPQAKGKRAHKAE